MSIKGVQSIQGAPSSTNEVKRLAPKPSQNSENSDAVKIRLGSVASISASTGGASQAGGPPPASGESGGPVSD